MSRYYGDMVFDLDYILYVVEPRVTLSYYSTNHEALLLYLCCSYIMCIVQATVWTAALLMLPSLLK